MLLIVLLHCAICNVFGQELIPIDLVKLSQITLAESPLVKQNILSISRAEGSLQIQKSTFDYLLTSEASVKRSTENLFQADSRYDLIGDFFKSRSTGISVGLQKPFRSSLIANVSLDYSMINNNFPLNGFGENIGSFIGNHTVTSSFSLTQPLLKGKGKTIATGLERVSKLNLESTNSNVQFRNSFELLRMSSAYWEYLGAYKSLKIYKRNRERVKRVLEVTEELVKADKRPAGDIAQVQADLANQERQTKIAEQTLYRAKLNLGRIVGLREEESKQLGIPLEEFPTIIGSGYKEGIKEMNFLELAQQNRADIEAAKKLEEARELQLRLIENNKKPQLDLTGFVNYGGVNSGNGLRRALGAFSEEDGRSVGYGVRLKFSFPLNNNFARGNFIQSETALKDQEIKTKDLQRNIDLNVSIAFNNLQYNIQVLEKAKEVLEFYKKVYSNEQVKFKNGMTILLNLIQFQERLTFAELDYMQARQQFAIAIVNLRYETGTLLVQKEGRQNVNKEQFFTIPKYKKQN